MEFLNLQSDLNICLTISSSRNNCVGHINHTDSSKKIHNKKNNKDVDNPHQTGSAAIQNLMLTIMKQIALHKDQEKLVKYFIQSNTTVFYYSFFFEKNKTNHTQQSC